MSDRNVGSVLVFDKAERFAGIVTERDILKKVAAKGQDAASITLADVLTSEVVSCTMESSISTVEELMHWHNIRHIPVIQDGQPVAILSSRDIIAYQIAKSKDMKLAAEQIARMSVELKSSDFDQLASWAVREVAKVFSARNTLLWIETDSDGDIAGGIVARTGCQCGDPDISSQIAACRSNHGPAFAPIQNTSGCSRNGACSHSLVIPLQISECARDRKHGVQLRCGFLCVCGLERKGLEADEVMLYKASLLSEILSSSLTNAYLYREYSAAKNQSLTDSLTSLGTRRLLDTELENEYVRARRYGHPFCILVMDIDKFKLINDGSGHAVGDEVLRRVARALLKTKRSTDVAVRYGGDELVMLMPETDKEQGLMVGERLRALVEEESRHSDGPAVTISCGLAQWSPEHDVMPKEVFQRADAALYDAKKAGRNRVCVSEMETIAL